MFYSSRQSQLLKKKPSNQGFTIVELLIVVVVIAILAAIIIVSYNGIRERAVTSAMQSELSSALTVLKLDHAKTDSYPLTPEAANEGKGLAFSSGTTVLYVPESNTTTPQTFCLSISKGSYSYYVTQSTQITTGSCTPPALTYSQEVLADTPSAYWRFQNTSGTTVADASGNSRPLTLSNASGIGAAGLSGESGDYSWDKPDVVSSVGIYGSAPNAAWQHVPAFTVEAIIQPDKTSGYNAIISHDGSTTRSWNLYVYSGKLLVYDYSVAGANAAVGTQTIAVGQRYHVAMTYAAGTVTLYVNGVQDGQGTGKSLRTTTSSMPFLVGGSYAGTSVPTLGFDGRIDEVGFYDKVLSDVRLKAHATAAGL